VPVRRGTCPSVAGVTFTTHSSAGDVSGAACVALADSSSTASEYGRRSSGTEEPSRAVQYAGPSSGPKGACLHDQLGHLQAARPLRTSGGMRSTACCGVVHGEHGRGSAPAKGVVEALVLPHFRHRLVRCLGTCL
jgi:hypothetical protein